MRVLVTGANGLIGQAFCAEARNRGHEVLALVRRAGLKLPKGSVQVHGSLSDPPWATIEAFRPDAALHLAWTATPGRNFHSLENETLVDQSDMFFRGLAARGVGHLAGAGTFIEYAASKSPLVEDASELLPLYPYSRAKAETLNRLRSLAAAANLRWSWFRFFNVFGDGEAPSRLISATMLALAAGRPAVVQTPDSIRDFIYVSDVARALTYALEQGLSGCINVGSGVGARTFDVALEAAAVIRADVSLVQRLEPPGDDTMAHAVADISKLRGLGWEPHLSRREGLERLWNSLKP